MYEAGSNYLPHPLPLRLTGKDAANGYDDNDCDDNDCDDAAPAKTNPPMVRMIRFVQAPDGVITPDIRANLPGSGLWLSACQDAVQTALHHGVFARFWPESNLSASSGCKLDNLAQRTEQALLRLIRNLLCRAFQASQYVSGYTQIKQIPIHKISTGLLFKARNLAHHGSRLSARLERQAGVTACDLLDGSELSPSSTGYDAHAWLAPGGIATRLTDELERLQGFRKPVAEIEKQPGVIG